MNRESLRMKKVDNYDKNNYQAQQRVGFFYYFIGEHKVKMKEKKYLKRF